MKLIILLTALLISMPSYSQDKEISKAMTLALASYASSSQSASPNKAFTYLSDRDNVDRLGLGEVFIQNKISADGTVIITRVPNVNNFLDPSKIYNTISIGSISKCQCDYGTVTIQSDKLIIKTDRVPLSVRCESSDGKYREFYQTILK